eukprot:Gregarina_sp_Pseudo_9__2775@NODE_300_length_3235_cov_22_680538_g281_i0_p1_GENE_NODE_300_length_3235_cov_22_680538_g281_i0NODE_300_length_3235_cov_22_680538_g281_i0_p1_ORF_typecomplete_len643_score85_11HEAT_2/PF13646_6/0_22HEAT_2/PF13646_6/0_76HEAT_2/PF13646_6/0_0036HEAT_2/PF13646_6/0_00077HEAT_2/PF13646_6/0_0041HEAT_2/PF13646_6/2_9e02HEAT_2/PF13646_6/0_0022Vac14_Fab1_bd/PF12755_7/1_1e02Vac14_Fab1_bd/PF12755_7/1_9e02Vac14_Fab1_bd/PF12755_7/2_7e05Vac14_Fab1_bd/PF12755_7/0_48Vac14_Fab1_bd/PF12755_7
MSEEGLPPDCVSFWRKEFYDSAETSADQIAVLLNTRYICAAIDQHTLTTRLIPLLDEIARKGSIEDEVLFQVVQQLFEVSGWLQENEQNFDLLLPTLEHLAQQEETVVRDAAVDTLGRILNERCINTPKTTFAREKLMPILDRLSSGSLPAKVSCCNLSPLIYKYLDEENAASARGAFIELSKDETPLVRRAAAAHFKSLVECMEGKDAMLYLFPSLMDCWKDNPADTQDQLRLSTLSAIIALSKRIPESQCREQLLPVVASAAFDPSWRIRLRVVQELPDMMAALPPKIVEEVLCAWLESAVRDSEAEVQNAAVDSLKGCIPYMQSCEIENKLLPLFLSLMEPEGTSCRAGLANLLGPIAKKLGKTATERQLLPLLSKFMADSLREVRNNAVEQLGDISEVLGAETASQALFPAVQSAILDQQWRIRLALVEQIPRMAKLFGPESFFKTEWEGLYFGALLDHVYAVRLAAVNSVVEIGSDFGVEWAGNYLLDNLLGLYDRAFKNSKAACNSASSTSSITTEELPSFVKTLQNCSRSIESYTSRNTLLHALGKISLVISVDDVSSKIIPRLVKSLNDPIPNVRFTTICILAELAETDRIPASTVEDTLIPRMNEAAKDGDPDVQFFASQGAEKCQKWLQAVR